MNHWLPSPVAMAFLCVMGLNAFAPMRTTECVAQGTKADYDRMRAQGRFGNQLVDRDKIDSFWLADDKAMWYRVDAAPGVTEYHLVFPATGENRILFTSESLKASESFSAVRDTNLRRLNLQFDSNLASAYFSSSGVFFQYDLKTESLTTVDSDAVPDSAKLDSVMVQPSGGSGQRSKLQVKNDTEGTLQTYWIDTQMRPQRYDDIPPGKSFVQNTYIGHWWLIRNSNGDNLACFQSESEDQVVTIDEESKVELRVPENARRLMGFYLRGNEGYQEPPRERRSFDRGSQSPDGQWRVAIRDHNVVLVATDANEAEKESDRFELTDSGSEESYFTNRIWWSPDSKYFVVLRETPAQSHPVHMVESSPNDQLQPKLHTHEYLKPGDKIRQQFPHLFSVQQTAEVPLSQELFENPWAVSDFRWLDDSSEFHFRYNQRGHQVMRMVGIKPSGEVRPVVEDVVDTFIDYTNKIYFEYLNDQRQILWASERDGWNHLYRVNVADGSIANQVTEGQWVLRRVLQVDQDSETIWFTASGVFKDQDPYFIHYGKVNFDGSGLVWLTEGNGTHRIDYSPERKYLLDSYSRLDMAPVQELRDAETGSLICKLESADTTRLVEAGWQAPEPFVAKGRDGETDIHGVIYRPQNFDADKTYPVIEYIYAGPHDAFVPKSFGPNRREKSLAELGFIVVQIDGMGTNHRGKAFHDVCWQNLGDSGFPDRILWMKAAAEKYPQMDLSQVGIYGGSAGGQSSTRAVLAFGEFYKAAVSDCGCHDNRMDKIWWNEQWMGWPIGDHYEQQSNVTNAHRLTGHLMLMVGELDRNVDPASTMQVVDALIKADKDFDLVVFPGGGHGSGSSNYGWRRTCDFFVEHLLGVQPRAN